MGDGQVHGHSLQTLDCHPSGTADGAAASNGQLLDRSTDAGRSMGEVLMGSEPLSVAVIFVMSRLGTNVWPMGGLVLPVVRSMLIGRSCVLVPGL